MVKIYFVNCIALNDGKLERSVDLDSGTHDILLMPIDRYSQAICVRISVEGRSGIAKPQKVHCDLGSIVYIESGNFYILSENFPDYLTLPKVLSQQTINDYLITIWRGDRRYLTVEKGDSYCNVPLKNSCEYEVSKSGRNAIVVCCENHIIIIADECEVKANIMGDYDIGDKIQTIVEYRGIINRTILENYSLDGDLIGRKIIRKQQECPNELLSHAFIESFIVGDIEFAHNMMCEALTTDMDAVINFVGMPKRIVTDELPFEQDYVISEYGDGTVKVFKPRIENGIVTDIDMDE